MKTYTHMHCNVFPKLSHVFSRTKVEYLMTKTFSFAEQKYNVWGPTLILGRTFCEVGLAAHFIYPVAKSALEFHGSHTHTHTHTHTRNPWLSKLVISSIRFHHFSNPLTSYTPIYPGLWIPTSKPMTSYFPWPVWSLHTLTWDPGTTVLTLSTSDCHTEEKRGRKEISSFIIRPSHPLVLLSFVMGQTRDRLPLLSGLWSFVIRQIRQVLFPSGFLFFAIGQIKQVILLSGLPLSWG